MSSRGCPPDRNAAGGSGNVEAIVPFIVSAEKSKRASFGRVRLTEPLTDCSSTLSCAGRVWDTASIEPFTVWASRLARTPRASIAPLTLDNDRLPPTSSTRTSPLTVWSSAATPGGTVSA